MPIFELWTALPVQHGRSWDRHFDSNRCAPFVLTQAWAGAIPDAVLLTRRAKPVAQDWWSNVLMTGVRKLTPEFMNLYAGQDGSVGPDPDHRRRALGTRAASMPIGPGRHWQGGAAIGTSTFAEPALRHDFGARRAVPPQGHYCAAGIFPLMHVCTGQLILRRRGQPSGAGRPRMCWV